MRKFLSLFAAVLVALVANAAVINIDNTTSDALRLALNNAASGDIIEMAAGTYVESNGDYIAFDGKEVIVRAAEGAEVLIQPQVPITIANGALAKFENIKFDASRLVELATWYEHLIYATDASANNRLMMEGCELYGFNLNKSMIYCGSSNALDAVTLNNCYIHDCMKSILFVENTSNAINVQVTNSTFANISTNTESYWAGIIDVRASGATLLVDHCTFYNVIPMNTDYSCVSKITLANGNASNCIFMLPTAQDGIRAMRGVTATNCITFNYLKDSGTGIHSSVTQNNCVQVDPLFVDAANGNFTLGEGSPALTMNDGQPIGDPRWAVAPTPVTHTYTVAGSSEVAFGTAWTPSLEANDMVLDGELYKWERTGLELPAGNIEFKVCEDHAWTNCWPSDNWVINTITESGIYTITITFNPNTKDINAVATKTGDLVVIPTIAMHGNFLGSWADTQNFEIAEGNATASLTLNLAAGNYEFGMRIGGAGNWTSNGVAFTRENASAVVEAGSGNLTLAADVEGDYIFTWTYETNTLAITFPAAAPQPVEMTAIYDWAGNIGTTVFGGNSNITTGNIKIHENTDEIPGIKFGSSYVYADGKWIAIKPVAGGFKAGDVLSVSVVFNNSDATKYCMADVYAADGATRMFRSDSASTLNGRNAGEPMVQTYTLASDQDSLFLGRYGNTGMFITLLKVERAGSTPIEEPAKFYITGDAATVGESLAWNPAAIKVTEDNYTLALAAGDYKLKVTVDGTWDTAKGFSDLTSAADGLSADNDGNICFTLAEAGDVVVTYTAEAFTVTGNFYVEPQPSTCDWDNIEFLGGPAEYANQFKVCKPENVGVVNIQQPGFATEMGIYMTFPSAAFGEISLPASAYDVQGAGIIFHLTAFTEEYTEVSVEVDGNPIVFTVYNAAAAPLPVEHTYTVAGGSDVAFGTTWDPANTANDMTLVEGLYTWEKTDLTLAAGNIEFKVCEDHAWAVAYPGENYVLNIPEAGIYTITITFNPDTKEVAAVATKTGSAEVDPVVSIAGSMNGWNASADVMTLAQDKATAAITLNLTAATYEFKVVINGGEWRSNAQEFTRESATAADMTGNLDNMHLVADIAGDYVFTWTFETNTLSIAFPIGDGIDNTAVEAKAIKRIVNGELRIEKNGVIYNAQGQVVK